jgi:hypothetical protein
MCEVTVSEVSLARYSNDVGVVTDVVDELIDNLVNEEGISAEAVTTGLMDAAAQVAAEVIFDTESCKHDSLLNLLSAFILAVDGRLAEMNQDAAERANVCSSCAHA